MEVCQQKNQNQVMMGFVRIVHFLSLISLLLTLMILARHTHTHTHIRVKVPKRGPPHFFTLRYTSNPIFSIKHFLASMMSNSKLFCVTINQGIKFMSKYAHTNKTEKRA